MKAILCVFCNRSHPPVIFEFLWNGGWGVAHLWKNEGVAPLRELLYSNVLKKSWQGAERPPPFWQCQDLEPQPLPNPGMSKLIGKRRKKWNQKIDKKWRKDMAAATARGKMDAMHYADAIQRSQQCFGHFKHFERKVRNEVWCIIYICSMFAYKCIFTSPIEHPYSHFAIGRYHFKKYICAKYISKYCSCFSEDIWEVALKKAIKLNWIVVKAWVHSATKLKEQLMQKYKGAEKLYCLD